MDNNIQFFSDFDGTITKEDTLGKLLSLYADKSWLDIEEDWVSGKIGSLECLEKQMALVKPLSPSELDDFINSIEIDENFPEFFKYLQENNIEFYVVSDGFDYFIKRILEKYNIHPTKIFANHLEVENGRFITTFPYFDSECVKKSGMCKCSIVKIYRNVTKSTVYAGDGLSDQCVSSKVDMLFAKGTLWDYSRRENYSNAIKFDNYKDIHSYMKEGEEFLC